MSHYAETMKRLAPPMRKVPANLLEIVGATIGAGRELKYPPVNVLTTVRDRLAAAYCIERVDDFILDCIHLVIAAELENRRLESEGCGK